MSNAGSRRLSHRNWKPKASWRHTTSASRPLMVSATADRRNGHERCPSKARPLRMLNETMRNVAAIAVHYHQHPPDGRRVGHARARSRFAVEATTRAPPAITKNSARRVSGQLSLPVRGRVPLGAAGSGVDAGARAATAAAGAESSGKGVLTASAENTSALTIDDTRLFALSRPSHEK